MLEAWLNFTIVVFVQLLLFIIHAYYEKRLSDAVHTLGRGILSGIVPGLLFDLIFGKFFDLFSYTLGFGLFFLVLNGTLLYGLFAANTLLMQRARLFHFFTWTMVIGAVFEIMNLFVPLWTWAFAVPSIEFFTVFLVLNFGGAIVIALAWHVLLGRRFLFIDNLLKKLR